MKRLLIVQDVPTQFDVPLYNHIASAAEFNLTVIYTQTHKHSGANYDAEIGRAPQWDHITSECYERIDLSSEQARRPGDVVALIADKAPDLALISGYYPPLHRKLVRPLKKLHIKVGLRSDNTLWHSDFKGIKGLVKKLVLPVWLRRYTSWHPVGTLAKEYLEVISHSRRPTYLFPYNVDNDWFAEQSAGFRDRRDALLADMGFSSENFIVLGIMKWHEREDPLTLIDAFHALLARQPDARLILVGDGPLHDRVMKRIDGMAEKVCTPGYVTYSELPKYYAIADVFVHPAPNEPWGVSVNEAMACGVPVIVAAGVGAKEDLVIEGETGFVFANGDSDELEKLLVKLMNGQELERMKDACIQKLKRWSYSQTISQFELALLGEK